MLSLTLAHAELKVAYEQLTGRAWTNEQAETIAYVNALLTILPNLEPQRADPIPQNNPADTNTLAQLRHRLADLLSKEKTLNIKKTDCDILFNIQLALARAYPFNNVLDGHQVPTWEEPVNFDELTRDTKDVVIFSCVPALSSATTLTYYKKSLLRNGDGGYNSAGDLRDINNTPLSEREITSLINQGVLEAPYSDGYLVGHTIGVCVTSLFFMMCLLLLIIAATIFPLILVLFLHVTPALVTATFSLMPVSVIGVLTIIDKCVHYFGRPVNDYIINPFTNACGKLGELIEIGVLSSYQFIKRNLGLKSAEGTNLMSLNLSSQATILSVISTPEERAEAEVIASNDSEKTAVPITGTPEVSTPQIVARISAAPYGEHRAQRTR